MSLPGAFFLYIATNILKERKRFQAHLNRIQAQSWLVILSFTLYAVRVIYQNTGKLPQLHFLANMTVNISTRCTFPPSFFHFSIWPIDFHYALV